MVTPKPPWKITVKMTHSKDTKNFRVYTADSEISPLPTLYIKKTAETPTKITVTITG